MRVEFSAGGVVVQHIHNQWQVLLVKHAQHGHWGFPKGHIADTHKNESREEAALREVQEETGIQAQLNQALPPITYWYEMNGEKRKKTVYFYLMSPIGGDFSQKDHEMELVEWVPVEKAFDQISFETERNILKQARELLDKSVVLEA